MVSFKTMFALREVDEQLGRLSRMLASRFTPGEYALIVTADHGQCPTVDLAGGVRVDPIQLKDDLNREFGGPILDVVTRVVPSEVYLDDRALWDVGASRDDVAAYLRDYRYRDNIGPYVSRDAIEWNRLDQKPFAAVLSTDYIEGLGDRDLSSFGPGRYHAATARRRHDDRAPPRHRAGPDPSGTGAPPPVLQRVRVVHPGSERPGQRRLRGGQSPGDCDAGVRGGPPAMGGAPGQGLVRVQVQRAVRAGRRGGRAARPPRRPVRGRGHLPDRRRIRRAEHHGRGRHRPRRGGGVHLAALVLLRAPDRRPRRHAGSGEGEATVLGPRHRCYRRRHDRPNPSHHREFAEQPDRADLPGRPAPGTGEGADRGLRAERPARLPDLR